MKMKIQIASKMFFSLFLIIFCASLILPVGMINIQPADATALTTANLLNTATIGESGLSTSTTNLKTMIMKVIGIVLGFLGIIAVIIVIIGGFKWMTSGGAEDKTKAARDLIVSGMIGLVIVLIAYTIVHFVSEALLNTTNGILK
ncbi:MAG: hypothetical protein AAB526_01740 [Patescibacteria group bacterium]